MSAPLFMAYCHWPLPFFLAGLRRRLSGYCAAEIGFFLCVYGFRKHRPSWFAKLYLRMQGHEPYGKWLMQITCHSPWSSRKWVTLKLSI